MNGEVQILTRAERLGSLAAAISCIAVFGASVTLMSPVISLNLEARGVDATTIGAIGSAPAIGMLIANFIIPALVRRMSLRGFLFACIAAQLVLVLLMPVFDSVPAWFILRGLTGMTMNGLFVASETWINAVAEERSRGRVIAAYGAALSASFALAPLLVPLTGTEGWAPFLACAGIISLAALPLLRAGHLSPEITGKASFSIISFLWIAPTLAAGVFLTAFKEMSMGAILPVYGVHNGLTVGSAATLLTAAYGGALLLQFPIGWLADRVDRMRLLLVFTVIGLMGTFLLPFIITAPPLVLWLGVACWVGLFTGVYIVSMTLVGQRFKGAELVTANASFGFLWGIGSLVGPALSGRAMDIWDPNGFPATLGIVTALVLALMLYRTFKRPAKI